MQKLCRYYGYAVCVGLGGGVGHITVIRVCTMQNTVSLLRVCCLCRVRRGSATITGMLSE